MARRRKPGDAVPQTPPARKQAPKPEMKRETKRPKDAVLGYMRERYGNY